MTLRSKQASRAESAQVTAQGLTCAAPRIASLPRQATDSTTVAHSDDPTPQAPQVVLDAGSCHPDPATPRVCGPNSLTRMHVERGVSTWLDRLSREVLVNGSLGRMVAAGVRGIGAGGPDLAYALEPSAQYDEQLSWLQARGCSAQEAYWELAGTDAQSACATLRPVFDMSQGTDGFVSLQLTAAYPRHTQEAVTTACQLNRRIDRPNLLLAIPATGAGVLALRASVATGCNTNATSIFSLARYAAVVEAYQSGIEALLARGGDPSTVYGVASFSLRPLDAEVDRRIDQLRGSGARELRGLAAVAQAMLASRLFEERFSTERWARLARRGATSQRLAWVGTGTELESEHIPSHLDALTVRNTIQVLSASSVARLNARSLGAPALGIDASEAAGVVSALASLGIDLDDVATVLEGESSARARESLTDALDRISGWSGRE